METFEKTTTDFKEFEENWKTLFHERAEKQSEYEEIMLQMRGRGTQDIQKGYQKLPLVSLLPYFCQFDTRELCNKNTFKILNSLPSDQNETDSLSKAPNSTSCIPI